MGIGKNSDMVGKIPTYSQKNSDMVGKKDWEGYMKA
jgi:hypothetical protein